MRWHKAWHIIYELPLLKDDVKMLEGLLKGGEPEIQKAMLFEYWQRWKAAEKHEPTEHKRPNYGRWWANHWIRSEVDQLRHEEPEVVQKYREAIKTPPPACCHTCAFYTDKGMCDKFQMQPPEDFAATPDLCPEYMQEVPF